MCELSGGFRVRQVTQLPRALMENSGPPFQTSPINSFYTLQNSGDFPPKRSLHVSLGSKPQFAANLLVPVLRNRINLQEKKNKGP